MPNSEGTRADHGGDGDAAYIYESFEHFMQSRGGTSAGTTEDPYRWTITPAKAEGEMMARDNTHLDGTATHVDGAVDGSATAGTRDGGE